MQILVFVYDGNKVDCDRLCFQCCTCLFSFLLLFLYDCDFDDVSSNSVTGKNLAADELWLIVARRLCSTQT